MAILLSGLLTLTACGFQLAGTAPADNGFEGLFVEDRVGIQQRIDQPVADQLRADLAFHNNRIFDGAQSDMPGLVILDESNIERGLSLTIGLFERQLELVKDVQYQILDSSGNILVADSVSATRVLIEDQSNPSAKYREREILITAINRDISRQLVRRLDAALSKPAPSAAQ